MITERAALVVDDQPLTTTLVSNILTTDGFNVAVANSFEDAKKELLTFDPDIAVLDLDLGGGPTGIDLAYYITAEYPQTSILILSSYPALASDNSGIDKLPSKANFVSKSSISEVSILLKAVQDTLAGQSAARAPKNGKLVKLTRNQFSVLRDLARGYSLARIADDRKLTKNAIEKTTARIYDRLELDPKRHSNQRVEAVRIYIKEAGIPDRVISE